MNEQTKPSKSPVSRAQKQSSRSLLLPPPSLMPRNSPPSLPSHHEDEFLSNTIAANTISPSPRGPPSMKHIAGIRLPPPPPHAMTGNNKTTTATSLHPTQPATRHDAGGLKSLMESSLGSQKSNAIKHNHHTHYLQQSTTGTQNLFDEDDDDNNNQNDDEHVKILRGAPFSCIGIQAGSSKNSFYLASKDETHDSINENHSQQQQQQQQQSFFSSVIKPKSTGHSRNQSQNIIKQQQQQQRTLQQQVSSPTYLPSRATKTFLGDLFLSQSQNESAIGFSQHHCSIPELGGSHERKQQITTATFTSPKQSHKPATGNLPSTAASTPQTLDITSTIMGIFDRRRRGIHSRQISLNANSSITALNNQNNPQNSQVAAPQLIPLSSLPKHDDQTATFSKKHSSTTYSAHEKKWIQMHSTIAPLTQPLKQQEPSKEFPENQQQQETIQIDSKINKFYKTTSDRLQLHSPILTSFLSPNSQASSHKRIQSTSTLASPSATAQKPFYHPFAHSITSEKNKNSLHNTHSSLTNKFFLSNVNKFQSSFNSKSLLDSLSAANGLLLPPQKQYQSHSAAWNTQNKNKLLSTTAIQLDKSRETKQPIKVEADEDNDLVLENELNRRKNNPINTFKNHLNQSQNNANNTSQVIIEENNNMIKDEILLSLTQSERIIAMNPSAAALARTVENYFGSKNYLRKSKKQLSKSLHKNQKKKNTIFEYTSASTLRSRSSLLRSKEDDLQNASEINGTPHEQSKNNMMLLSSTVSPSSFFGAAATTAVAAASTNSSQNSTPSSHANQLGLAAAAAAATGTTPGLFNQHQQQSQQSQSKNLSSSAANTPSIGQFDKKRKALQYIQQEKKQAALFGGAKRGAEASGSIAAELVSRKAIGDEEWDIVREKIKLQKYFLDESIPILEKRANFKDIQAFYAPDAMHVDERIAREIFLYLSTLKGFFLKIDPILPQSVSQLRKYAEIISGLLVNAGVVSAGQLLQRQNSILTITENNNNNSNSSKTQFQQPPPPPPEVLPQNLVQIKKSQWASKPVTHIHD